MSERPLPAIKGAYASDTDTVRPQKSLFALIDFLGFSAQIRAAEAEGRLDELLNQVRSFVGEWRDVFVDKYGSRDGSRHWETKFFTDNIIIGAPLRSEGANPEMAGMLDSLQLFQIDAIRQGFFVRGGLSCGALYMDDDIAFGVPLVDAHEVEACVARSPRIVLARSARHFLAERMGPREKDHENAPFYRDFLRDEDGEWFVNYLEGCFHNYTEPPEFSWVEAHRNMVSAKLVTYADSARVHEKYVWVARYHNYWCESWRIPEYRVAGHDPLRVTRMNYAELAA